MSETKTQDYRGDSIGPTCQKIEDMIKYARPIIYRWPSFYRRTLGEDIMREMMTLLRLATKARLKYYSKTTLSELDTEKEILKVLVRTANDTTFQDRGEKTRKLLNDQSYGVWSAKLVEIGRLIGGWIISIENKGRNDDKKAR